MDVSPTPGSRPRHRRSDRYAEEIEAPQPQEAPQTVPQPYVPTPPPIFDEPVPPRRTARARRPLMDEPAAEKPREEPEKPRMPGWLIAALTGCFLLILALIAAQAMMMAYLKQQEDARLTAHQALLDYYHVQENGGAARITYQDWIERYAGEYNLQPAFLAAVIRNESSFRTDAVSSAGARGLMQMMPDTAAWIAGKLGVGNFSFDSMFDAETNIRFGAWYLGYLSKLFRGDAVLVSAAYHAGQTTVTQWLSDRSISEDGATIPLEKLRDGPTKTYAGRVTQAYGIYQALLYPDEPFGEGADAAGGGDLPDVEPTSFIQR